VEENWDEEDEESASTPAGKPLQFSLRTLMTVVTAAAIFFSLVAWWGLYPVVFILGSALGTFLGLLLCTYIGLGFSFDNLPWDISKCLIVSCVTIGPLYLLPLLQIPILSTSAYPLVPPLCYWFGMQVAWDDLESPEIFISAIVSFFTWATITYLTSLLFPL
jgi:hypothetical protein